MILHGMEFPILNVHHNGRRLLHLYAKLGAGIRMNNIEEGPLLPYEKLKRNVNIIRQRSVLLLEIFISNYIKVLPYREA